jgi:quercetin dioxygenase-like cupin family protein
MTTYIAEQTPATELPGEAVPYVIEAGSGRAHVLLGEVGRALVGAEESRGAMSVMSLDGPRAERPIPLHYHDEEYEFFYVLRGAVQLWADDESRVLAPETSATSRRARFTPTSYEATTPRSSARWFPAAGTASST